MPHADAAAADPLAHSQLQEEERDPNDDQQHQVGHQVGTWGGGRDVGGCLEHSSRVREGWQPGAIALATSPIILKPSPVPVLLQERSGSHVRPTTRWPPRPPSSPWLP